MTPQSPPFSPHGKGSKFRSENVKIHVKPTTRKPQDCPPLIRKPPHRRPLFGARLGKRLAQTRWNSFVGSPGSRLAKIMLPRLGRHLWNSFVAHAKQHYWQAYESVFTPPSLVLECAGAVDGTPCPHALRIDLCASDAHRMSGLLHLDHERKVRETCRVWLENLPPQPRTWHDGSDREDLCHALLGVWNGVGPCCMRFRCSARRMRGGWLPSSASSLSECPSFLATFLTAFLGGSSLGSGSATLGPPPASRPQFP